MAESKSNSGSGLEPNVAALLAWIFAPVTSIIFLLVDKDDKFVKFHALQSLVYTVVAWAAFFVIYTILSIVTFGIGAVCCLPLAFIVPIVNIYAGIKAYNKEMYKLPYLGDWVEKQM